MTVVIGTAGHIDHGKTTLLRVLTGIDADRLPEEQRRGMTIDVGFAHLDLDDGSSLDFVDVPGHDALIGNMLVGAGEIDAMLLVVAADDGIRPQTIEHLALFDTLGIPDGVVAITKTDLVPPERVVEVADAVADLLSRTLHLAGRPIVGVSPTDLASLDRLRSELLELRDRVNARAIAQPSGPTRLAIDRAFSVKGRGMVATGTLRGGSIRAGDRLWLLPGSTEVRVRGLQVHHTAADAAEPGRVALNLAGAELTDLARGGVLVAGDGIEPTDRLLVTLERPASLDVAARKAGAAGWAPGDGSRLRLHLGTSAVEAVVGRRGREAFELPDGRLTAVLRLGVPIATFPGDRAVLRRPSPGEVVAGITVLDPSPARGLSRRRATPERLATLALAIDEGDVDGGLDARVALHGVVATEAGLILAPDLAAGLEGAALGTVADHHAVEPATSGLPAARLQAALRLAARRSVTIRRTDAAALDTAISRLLEDLVARRRLAREGDRYRDPSRAAGPPPALAAAMDLLVAILDVPAPPDLSEAARAAGCPPDGVRGLEASGRIVRVDRDLAWAAPRFHHLAAVALDLARQGPLAPAALRDATGTSRRVVMPLLEDLDRRGILARTPAGHVPGPRAPRAAEITEAVGSARPAEPAEPTR